MYRLLLGGALMSVVLVPARGQGFMVGSPVQIRNQPIDVSRALRPTAGVSRSMNLAAPSAGLRNFSFSNLFRTTSPGMLPSSPPQVSVLPQKQNIFQPNLPKGAVNLFDAPKNDANKGTASAIKLK